MMGSALERAAALSFDNYDPGVVISAVNTLLPLGKQQVLSDIGDLARAGDDAIGLHWVLRSIFEMPPDLGYPPVRWGEPDVPRPRDPRAFPRFPLVLAAHVPLLVVHGYTLAGLPEPVSTHLDAYAAAGALRVAPLEPPEDLEVAEREFLKQWKQAYGVDTLSRASELAATQLARLAGS